MTVDVASDAPLNISAFSAGGALVTWLFFHWYHVRGDYAALAFSISPLITYSAIRLLLSEAQTSHLLLTLLYVVVFAASVVLLSICYRLSPLHPLANYPGPRSWWFTNLQLVRLAMSGKRHQRIHELHMRHGPIVRVGHNTLSINSLSALNPLYGPTLSMEKSELYRLPGHQDVMCLFYKQDLHLHNERKRVWMKGLSAAATKNYIPCIERRTWELASYIERRQTESKEGAASLSECFSHWAYDLMGDIMYGGCNDYALMAKGDSERLVMTGKEGMVAIECFGQAPWLMDIIWHVPVSEAMVKYSAISAAMMHKRIKVNDATSMRDLSSYLLEGSRSGQTIPLPDLELEAVNALFGGGDTIAGSLSMVFYYLLSHPQYYKQLYDVLHAEFPDPMEHLEGSRLAGISLLGDVIDESLRLQTAFYFPRIVPSGGVTIDGSFIPEGTIVSVASYSQQIDPTNFYPDPLEFKPERWLPGGLGPDTKTERNALFSFSTGQHVCVGKAFAYQQMQYVIARLVLSFDMAFPDSFDKEAFRNGILHKRTLILEKPLLVKLTRRPGAEIPDLK